MSESVSSGPNGARNCLEFLHCNKCFYPLSVIPNDSPHRPFSLTSCWHVICGVCFKKHGAQSNFCCVCSRSSIRTLRLESPMPDNLKRLFCNYVAEWETSQNWADERRRAQASTLREVAKALEEIARELSSTPSSSSKTGDAASLRKTAYFQLDQWRSLARGYGRMWTHCKKSKDELKKYQSELHDVQRALREAEEEKRKMKEQFRAMQQRQQQPRNVPSPQQQQQGVHRPTTSTPKFFDQTIPNSRSPFFRKNPAHPQKQASSSSGSGGVGRENHDPASASSSGGRRRSADPFCPVAAVGRHGAASIGRDKMGLKTPHIFAEADLGSDLMTSPYFGAAVRR